MGRVAQRTSSSRRAQIVRLLSRRLALDVAAELWGVETKAEFQRGGYGAQGGGDGGGQVGSRGPGEVAGALARRVVTFDHEILDWSAILAQFLLNSAQFGSIRLQLS